VPGNPFRYGPPVSAPHFAGRSSELEVLCALAERGQPVAVTARRGFGKTSLLLGAGRRLAAAGRQVVHADALRTPNLGEVLARLDDPVRSARVVLILDEVQGIATGDPSVSTQLRSLADRHDRRSLIMAGVPGPSTARLLFGGGAPLGSRIAHLQLGMIPDGIILDFLRTRAASGGKPLSPEAAAQLVRSSRGVPLHVQRLAHACYECATTDMNEATVATGLRQVVEQESGRYRELLSRLAVGHRRVLAVLSAGGVAHPQSADFVRATGYANPAAARKSLRTLQDEGLVTHDGRAFQIADPFLSHWLADAPPLL
jgi:hypothetical protein